MKNFPQTVKVSIKAVLYRHVFGCGIQNFQPHFTILYCYDYQCIYLNRVVYQGVVTVLENKVENINGQFAYQANLESRQGKRNLLLQLERGS